MKIKTKIFTYGPGYELRPDKWTKVRVFMVGRYPGRDWLDHFPH